MAATSPFILLLEIALAVFAVVFAAWTIGRFFDIVGGPRPEPWGFDVVGAPKDSSAECHLEVLAGGKRGNTGHVAGWFRVDDPDE